MLALALVTFLHMVVGEMAPKSWAIARPERSAMILAPPFRAFTAVVRPLLAALNSTTNLLLRMVGVHPRDSAQVSRTPEQLRLLAVESRRLGLIEETDLNLLTAALDAPRAPLADLVIPLGDIVSVAASATPQEVIDTAARTGRTRMMLRGPGNGGPARMVHVRDAYLARARDRRTAGRGARAPGPDAADRRAGRRRGDDAARPPQPSRPGAGHRRPSRRTDQPGRPADHPAHPGLTTHWRQPLLTRSPCQLILTP